MIRDSLKSCPPHPEGQERPEKFVEPSDGLPVNVWLIGQDGPERQRRGKYTRDSVRGHPGKMLPELARRLIEAYTRPGDRVLDPMSGIGTLGVEAVHLNRHYVGIELEPRFVSWQLENLECARGGGAKGTFAVCRGDARRLNFSYSSIAPQFMTNLGPFDAVLTSPPYADRLRFQKNQVSPKLRELFRQGLLSRSFLPASYGRNGDNLGNLAGESYLQAMRHVYAGCFRLLKPGGILALVLQPVRRRERLLPIHHDAVRLCREVGFHYLDEVVAVTARIETGSKTPARVVSHASYGRRRAVASLRGQGYPVTLGQVEYVLVFQKPMGLDLHRPEDPGPTAPATTKAAVGPPLRVPLLA